MHKRLFFIIESKNHTKFYLTVRFIDLMVKTNLSMMHCKQLKKKLSMMKYLSHLCTEFKKLRCNEIFFFLSSLQKYTQNKLRVKSLYLSKTIIFNIISKPKQRLVLKGAEVMKNKNTNSTYLLLS